MTKKEIAQKIVDEKISEIGKWDRAGRFYPIEETFEIVQTLSSIRRPSRKWGYSYYKHLFTKKAKNQAMEYLKEGEK